MGGLGVLQMEGGVVEMPLLEPGGAREAGGGRQAAAEPAGTSETLRATRARAAAAVAKTGPSRARARARPVC